MYYLWQDKRGVCYITNYKETNKDGKVKVDGYGFIEVDLKFKSEVKNDLLSFAQNPSNNTFIK